MATIASNVQWGSGPKIYFDFSYEKKREGTTQYYNITVSCKPLSGTHYFGYPIYLQIFLDGTQSASHTLKNASPSQWSSALTYSTGWLGVNSKVSGTTALKIRIYSGSGSSRENSYSYSLSVDPAASTISCSSASIESNPIITVNRASSLYSHDIAYSFGELRGNVVIRSILTSITNWTIPTSFYSQIPDDKTGECTLTCTTYYGSVQIGEPTTCKFTVTTDETKCKPTVSGNVVDTNPITAALTGNAENSLVRFFSTASCTIDVTLHKNAGSVLLQTINNVSVPSDVDTLVIPNVETGVFDFYAKDSRTYHDADKVERTLIPYIRLTNDASIYRDDPTSGKATLKIEGNYYNGSFGAEHNALKVEYRVGGGDYIEVTPTVEDNKYSVTVPLTGYDYQSSFDFEAVVSDKLDRVSRPLTLMKGIPVFDWGEEDFRFNVPVFINGENILVKLVELESRISALTKE